MSITTPRAHGIFVAGDTITFTVDSGVSAYSVADIHGTVVSSGSASGTTVTPSPPTGGWRNGWYMLSLTTTSTNQQFPFSVISDDNRFPEVTAWSTWSEGIHDPAGRGMRLLARSIGGLGGYRHEKTEDTTAVQGNRETLDTYAYNDTTRQPAQWVALSDNTVGYATIGALMFFRADEGAGNDWTVTVSAGSNYGAKIIVTDAITSDVLETWDDQATCDAAQYTINTGSARITCGCAGGKSLQQVPVSGTGTLAAAPNAATVARVAAVAGVGINLVEGPRNEAAQHDDQLAAFSLAFHRTAHAAATGITAMVPCVLGATGRLPGFVASCVRFGYQPDAISFHPYNNIWLELAAQDAAFDVILSPVRDAWPDMDLYCTEFGARDFGEYHYSAPYMAATQTANLVGYIETQGIPKERFYWFYDASHGFGGFTSWWCNGDLSLNPIWTAYRGMSERMYGRTLDQRLRITGPLDRWVFAARWQDATTQAVFIQSCGMQTATATVTTTGTTTVYDLFGNVLDTRVGGTFAQVFDQLGVWVEATTVDVVDVDDSSKAGDRNLADVRYTGAVLTSSTDKILSALTVGKLTGYPDKLLGDRTGLGSGSWEDGTQADPGALPSTITATFQCEQDVSRAIIAGARPSIDAQKNGIIGMTVEALVDGTWTTVATVDNPVNSTTWGTWSIGSGQTWTHVGYWDGAYVWHHQFPTVRCTAIRWVVTDTSIGTYDQAVVDDSAGNAAVDSEYLTLHFVGAYRD